MTVKNIRHNFNLRMATLNIILYFKSTLLLTLISPKSSISSELIIQATAWLSGFTKYTSQLSFKLHDIGAFPFSLPVSKSSFLRSIVKVDYFFLWKSIKSYKLTSVITSQLIRRKSFFIYSITFTYILSAILNKALAELRSSLTLITFISGLDFPL